MAEPGAVSSGIYRYEFGADVPLGDVEESLLLAVLAVESLHGRARVHLDASFRLDETTRTCVIDAGTEISRAIARIFTGFLTREFGERAFRIEKGQGAPALRGEAKKRSDTFGVAPVGRK